MPIVQQDTKYICDVCEVVEEFSGAEVAFYSGWALIQHPVMTHRLIVCFGCLFIRLYGPDLNTATYSGRDEVLKKWEEIENGKK